MSDSDRELKREDNRPSPSHSPSSAAVTSSSVAAAVCVDRYKACMILAAVADAVGYKNGSWEFLTDGVVLHKQFEKITNGNGMKELKIGPAWRCSDDTIMHIATAKAISQDASELFDLAAVCAAIAIEYKDCWKHMSGRAPGGTTAKSVSMLKKDGSNWNEIPFKEKSGGCGASMRAACIGLRYWRESEEEHLIGVSIESGRITHHNPTAYLGAYVAALFTAYAIRGIPCRAWGHLFIKSLPNVKEYIRRSNREVLSNINSFDFFVTHWKDYLALRKIEEGKNEPTFPDEYGVEEREKFYTKISFSGWGGASGHDSVLIAYDALLGAKDDWNELCLRGVLHGGDNDSTGTIAAAWWGAVYGFQNVPKANYKHVEFAKVCKKLGEKLHRIVQPQQTGFLKFF